MKDWFVGIAAMTAAIVLLLGLTWLFQGNDFFMAKVFAPKMEQVRRDTFENSKAYNDGMAQELSAMEFQYQQAKPESRAALASIILHRVAGYDESKLPFDLAQFIDGLRNTRVQ